MLNWSTLTTEITSASVSAFLTASNSNGIKLRNIQYLDDLRIQANVSGSDYFTLCKIASKHGDTLKLVGKRGLFFLVLQWLQRPVLLCGIIIWLFLVLYLPTRVLFVRVEGNHTVDSSFIIEAARKCGIQFGASRRYVRSEKVKNMLLSEIDSFQWAGVNTYGCVAVISVKERMNLMNDSPDFRVNSIVAARDGVILKMTAIKGNPICKVGQAVRMGQVLVSGYTDCGLSLKAERAEAEVTALTNHSIDAVSLNSLTRRTSLEKIKVRYSIQIGKNVVKLYKDSGIPDTGCVKIYTQNFLTLPGGFQLPVSLIEEQLHFYEYENTSLLENDFVWMKQAAEAYLKSNMVAGKILRGNAQGQMVDDIYCLNGIYTCEEMIGQVRIEEIGKHDGKRNR